MKLSLLYALHNRYRSSIRYGIILFYPAHMMYLHYHCSPTLKFPFFLPLPPLPPLVNLAGSNGFRFTERLFPSKTSSAIAFPQAGAHAIPQHYCLCNRFQWHNCTTCRIRLDELKNARMAHDTKNKHLRCDQHLYMHQTSPEQLPCTALHQEGMASYLNGKI